MVPVLSRRAGPQQKIKAMDVASGVASREKTMSGGRMALGGAEGVGLCI